MSDHVLIEGLRFDAIVGVRPAERTTPQTLEIDIDMTVDCRPAARSGKLDDAVSYSEVAKRIQAFVIEQKFELLESLAEDCASLVLRYPAVSAVTFTVRKPQALPNADAVGVRIER